MLISHAHRFIFIHVYKVAGNSIRKALTPYAHTWTKKNRLRALFNRKLRIFSEEFSGHCTARDIKAKIPSDMFMEYFKFAFVRNPWDWQVSLYAFARQTPDHQQHELMKKLTFEQYIDWRVHEDLHLQKYFIYDGDQCMVDFIGRFENIDEDLREITQKIGLNKATLPHVNSSKRGNYRKYYNAHTRQLVADAFKEDIELFQYSF